MCRNYLSIMFICVEIIGLCALLIIALILCVYI